MSILNQEQMFRLALTSLLNNTMHCVLRSLMSDLYFLSFLGKVPSRKLLSKIVLLSKGATIHVLVEDYRRGDDHVFSNFLRSDPKHIEDRIKDMQNWTESVVEKISEYCENDQITVPTLKFHSLEGIKWIKQLKDSIHNKTDLLIVDNTVKPLELQLLEEMAKLECDLLLVGNSFWASNIKALCAIDPLHREDKHSIVDISIIARGNWLNEHYNASISLVYCRHIAPYLVKYKTQILTNQKMAVEGFILDQRLSHLTQYFTDGNPEEALPKTVKITKANLLVLGACKRSAFSKFWSGSTVEVLLHNPPCDLLLVNAFKQNSTKNHY